MRTFYRDLDLLRGCGIEILLESRKYTLSSSVSECLEKLPFPDPELSFADTAILAKGTAAPNRKLKLMLQQLTRG